MLALNPISGFSSTTLERKGEGEGEGEGGFKVDEDGFNMDCI